MDEAQKAPTPPARRARGEFLFFTLRSKKFLVSVTILLVLICIAVLGPIVDPTDPLAQTGLPERHPSLELGYWFGSTYFGEDVFAQFANGLRASFFVGLLGGGLAALIGMVVGFVAGYRGGWIDEILNMVTNVFLVIPTLAVLLVITSYLQARGVLFEAIFIGITSWPWAARAIRAQTFSLRSREFIDLAKLSGRSGWKVIVFEIAPNMSSYLFLTYILLFGGAILIAASLDFIGLGPTGGISLGLMMYNAVTWAAPLLGIWWWFIPPGIGIIATVGSLYVMNVGLDEIFNPKLRDI
ncbi:MAG: ABC transporter permease [Candidatus Limnocylindrales bacterium]